MLRTRSRALAFASSAAFALVLASSLAAADGIDSDQDGVSDELEDATQRTIAASPPHSKVTDVFEVSSRLGTGPVRDQFDFWYWPGHFGVWYGVEDGASVRFEVEMLRLLVWNDADADGRISDAEISDSIPLGSSAFEGVGVNRYEWRDSDGGRIYNFALDSPAVSFNITIAERFTPLDGLTLTPMEARMDVRLKPLPDPTASVALEFRFETGEDDVVRLENRSWAAERLFAPGEHAMNVTSQEGDRTASAFFSWGNEAVVSSGTVTVDSVYDETTSNLTLAYPGQAQGGVVHQMAFGVRSLAYDSIERLAPPPPPLQPDLYLFTGTFAGVAGLVAATVYLSNRRRLGHGDESRKP